MVAVTPGQEPAIELALVYRLALVRCSRKRVQEEVVSEAR